MASTILSLILLLLAMSQDTLGCFPIDDVFERSTIWSQDLRNPWVRMFVIGQMSDDFMTMETQTPDGNYKADVTCLKKFRHHRYLVKVEEPGEPKTFQCFQFTLLSHQVVRLARSEPQLNQLQVNCDSEKYTDDVEVMIAYRDMSRKACPLLGGYQVLFPESQNIKGRCLDSVQTYNPRLDFGCGGTYVVADFGEACAPNVPIQSQGPYIYQQKFGSLQCVASWDEPGEGNVKAMLLHINYDPYRFWCMHYQPVNGSNGELLNIHISFNGKCSRNIFKKTVKNLPEEYRTFGTLARYVLSTDKRCFEEKYIEDCQFKESKCFESRECPLNCKRCNEKVKKQDCGFTDAIGHWVGIDARHRIILDVKKHGFKVSDYGLFSCWNSSESKAQDVYSVVRNDPHSSCLPFYACAKLSSPSPGILNFFLVASEWDSQFGRPHQCKKLVRGEGILIPTKDFTMITLLDTQNLRQVSCNIEKDMLFPTTLGSCKMSVKKCSGSCNTLYADYDPISCGNDSRPNELEHEHVCHASLQLKTNIQGLITRSVMTGGFLCWIVKQEKDLYITSPDECNSEAIRRVLSYSDALRRNDPFMGIRILYYQDVAFSNKGFPFLITLMLLMLYFLKTINGPSTYILSSDRLRI